MAPSGFCIYEISDVALRMLEFGSMIVVLMVFGLIAAGLGMGLIIAARAPVGYQDETGFHFGQETGATSDEVPYAIPQAKPA
jgi:hypothetical protein